MKKSMMLLLVFIFSAIMAFAAMAEDNSDINISECIQSSEGNDDKVGSIADIEVVNNFDTIDKVADNDFVDFGSDEETVVPETEKETVVPETEKETVVPETEKETVVPETEKETVVPETEKETVVPETEKETVVPETEKETVVPETEKETVVPETEKETVVPETEKETVVPETREHTSRVVEEAHIVHFPQETEETTTDKSVVGIPVVYEDIVPESIPEAVPVVTDMVLPKTGDDYTAELALIVAIVSFVMMTVLVLESELKKSTEKRSENADFVKSVFNEENGETVSSDSAIDDYRNTTIVFKNIVKSLKQHIYNIFHMNLVPIWNTVVMTC